MEPGNLILLLPRVKVLPTMGRGGAVSSHEENELILGRCRISAVCNQNRLSVCTTLEDERRRNLYRPYSRLHVTKKFEIYQNRVEVIKLQRENAFKVELFALKPEYNQNENSKWAATRCRSNDMKTSTFAEVVANPGTGLKNQRTVS